jgi:hypothetical protein
MPRETPFDLKFTSREVTAWGGLALLKRMLDGMGFKEAVRRWDLPPPGSNRGYLPEQLIEQLMVSIWCGAARFAHTDITRLDTTLVRLFGWGKAAGHKAIIRLFQRFDQPIATRVQTSSYRWLFDTLRLNPITLDVDSTVLTRWGSQMEGAAKGYNAKNKGRASHHPLMAFVADWRLVANFWLRPGNTASSNNFESFIESTLDNLGQTRVGLLRADSGFYDKTIVARLAAKKINHIISARLTQGLQKAIVDGLLKLGLFAPDSGVQSRHGPLSGPVFEEYCHVVTQTIVQPRSPGRTRPQRSRSAEPPRPAPERGQRCACKENPGVNGQLQ